jgi:hypothetical protein
MKVMTWVGKIITLLSGILEEVELLQATMRTSLKMLLLCN